LLDEVAEGGVVYDIVTTPLDTTLLQEARERGLDTVDGLAMLIGQADHAFARFFGQKPPRGEDAALRRLILESVPA
jgi:shikimate dehydrogenase